ncbi:hypothetical protein SSX86_009240 [Deinandra increscens subsp. villosa]|uniref:Uncharacterized protein n=1 Tax=Deinandra increscens subsp. villosa TaxID=3103831 RepID=A0AAP0DCX3_9ASTR
MSTTNRRVKWHSTPPPPSPKIINLPRRRRTRRRKTRAAGDKAPATDNYKGKLESLFKEEDVAEGAAERWRLEAEMLRVECDFLKMEKNLAMKKLEKNRVRMERSLKSALKSVDSGRKKLCEGKKMDVVLEEGVKELSEKLEELQSSYSGEVNVDCSILTGKSQNKSIDEPFVSKTSNKCSGRCKLLVRKMAEQVRADTEQWSQMQVMLGQLRQEMEELQTSKSFWETQALVSNQEIQSLMIEVEEWREKAVGYETKANTLQDEVILVKGELEKMKKDQAKGKEIESTPKNVIISLSKQIEREAKSGLSCRMKGQCDAIVSNRHEKVEQSKKDSPPLSLAKQLAREKRILISRMTENPSKNSEILSDGRRNGCYLVRSPFKDIGNSSSSSTGMGTGTGTGTGTGRHNSNVVFPARMED